MLSAATYLLKILLLISLTNPSFLAQQDAPEDQHKRECKLYPHNVTIEKEGCSGEIPVFSCMGSCESKTSPRIFYTRCVIATSLLQSGLLVLCFVSLCRGAADTASAHFKVDCECCGITQILHRPKNITLACPHNDSTVVHEQMVPISLGCTCSDCFHDEYY